ncbi:MAG: hypothetical protein ABJB66_08380 [Gemmatimonadaceae bacterium]
MLTLLAAAALATLTAHTPVKPVAATLDATARATLDTAAARMGGIATLRSLQRLRVESITEWQRLSLDDRANPLISSYEWSTEFRDYAHPAWRYTRRFLGPTGWNEIVDLVVDSVAAIKNNGKWGPQNVAYVDERTEMFTFSPERLMMLAFDAPDAKSLPDTSMHATRYTRVRATINNFGTTLFFNKSEGGLALAQFRAAQPKDFGLAAFGVMDVSISYSRWQRVSRDVALNMPMQLDIHRVGKPYKRITILGVQLNPDFPADSLSMSDSLRTAFLALRGRAMYDLPVDTARIANDHFALFFTPGTPAGAVKLGGKWLFFEAGTAPMSIERSAAFLTRSDAATPIVGAILSQPGAQAGAVWLAEHKLSGWVTPGAKAYIDATMRGWKNTTRFQPVVSGSWIKIGTDSVRIESLDLPDYPNTAVIYSPTLQWVYSAPALTPLNIDRIAGFVKQRGWKVERIASARDIVGAPVPKRAP